MSFTIDEAFLLTCLRRGANCTTISIQNFDCKPFAVKSGTSFTGDIYSVSVQYECDGHPSSEFLICKVPYLRPFYDTIKEAGYYYKERYVYETVIPKLMEISPLTVVPRHYFTSESDVLVLEDLTKQGYFLADQALWNFEQSVLLLEELAVFHAATVKLNLKDSTAITPATHLTLFRQSLIARALKAVYPRVLACLQAEKVDPSVLQNFASYERKIIENGIWTICNRACDFNALLHGDLKANNILVRNDDDKPISVKILDYQTCVWSSPALELIFFYMATVEYEVFEKHQQELVDHYLGSLNGCLVGCDCRYTKEEYAADVAGSKIFQVFVLLFVGLFDIREALPGFYFGDGNSEVPSAEVEKIRCGEMFRRRFLKWFDHYKRLGYFDD